MLQRFFIMCSGADKFLLKDCSNGEQNKYAGIGATVFFTAVMAFIASSYALYTVFNNYYLAIGFGLIWGLLIFNLDRFIVSTIKKRNAFLDELLQATPRLILAIIIAIVISKPLELKLFEKEINQVLLEQKNTLTQNNKSQIALQYEPITEVLQQDIKALQDATKAKEVEVNALYDTYITEAEGTSGTKKLGKGPVYKEKRDKHDAALTEFQVLKETNTSKIKALETEIAKLKTDYNTQITSSQPIIDNFDGLMARVDALGTLPWLPSFFIFLLFLAIETSPIIAKLLASKGEYDFKLEAIENDIKSWTTQQENQKIKLLNTDNALNDKVYEAIKNEDELYNYKKDLAEKLLKKQQEAFYNSQSKIL
jgi:TM2 domain-containing membrane protein YozV